jgi:hypothetical protein
VFATAAPVAGFSVALENAPPPPKEKTQP